MPSVGCIKPVAGHEVLLLTPLAHQMSIIDDQGYYCMNDMNDDNEITPFENLSEEQKAIFLEALKSSSIDPASLGINTSSDNCYSERNSQGKRMFPTHFANRAGTRVVATKVNELAMPNNVALFQYGFMALSTDILIAFLDHPALEEVAVSCRLTGIKQEVRDVAVELHIIREIQISTKGDTVDWWSEEALDGYISDRIPYSLIAEGYFSIKREAPCVQAFLNYSESPTNLSMLAYDLSGQISRSMKELSLHHDFNGSWE